MTRSGKMQLRSAPKKRLVLPKRHGLSITAPQQAVKAAHEHERLHLMRYRDSKDSKCSMYSSTNRVCGSQQHPKHGQKTERSRDIGRTEKIPD